VYTCTVKSHDIAKFLKKSLSAKRLKTKIVTNSYGSIDVQLRRGIRKLHVDKNLTMKMGYVVYFISIGKKRYSFFSFKPTPVSAYNSIMGRPSIVNLGHGNYMKKLSHID